MKTSTLIVFALVAIVLVYLVRTCDTRREVVPEELHTATDALIESRQFIKKALVSPATADFDSSTKNVVKIDDYTFKVTSFVDSQNGFGAIVRTHYTCKITFDRDGSHVNCTEVSIN